MVTSDNVLMYISASHQHLILSYGGDLVLTKTAVVFNPIAFEKPFEINLKDIDDIHATHIIGPRANQIWVKSKGQTFRFVVSSWNKGKFVDAAKRQMSNVLALQQVAESNFICKDCHVKVMPQQQFCEHCGRILDWQNPNKP